MTELLFSPKHWSPRDKSSLAELERLRDIYPPEAFRAADGLYFFMGDVHLLHTPTGTIWGQIVMLLRLPGLGQEIAQAFWLSEDGWLAMYCSTLMQVRSAWYAKGTGRPWAQGLRLWVL